jgi:leader peptidase (prepilin peptidase)/N-methyltransferase
MTGLSFALLYLLSSFLKLPYYELLFILVITVPFMAIIFADFDYGIIPDSLTIFIILATGIYLVLVHPDKFLLNLLTGFISFVLFVSLYFVTRGRGMGFGDVKLAGAIGFLLGFPKVVLGMYMAFLTGAVIAIILILLGRKKLKKDTIAFGPFLAFSAVVSFIFGQFIIDFLRVYLNI